MKNTAPEPQLVDRCCSPGLQKVLQRLEIAAPERIAQLRASSSDKKIIAALAAAGDADEEQILQRLCADLGLERADLRSLKSLEKLRQAGLAANVDGRFLLEHRCLPLKREESYVTVVLADPLDLETIARLEYALGAKVRVTIARESEILQAVNRLLGIQQAENADFEATSSSVSAAKEVDLDADFDAQGTSEEAGSAAAPVVRFVNQILADAAQSKASDIHLEPNSNSLEVRYRIDGVMTPQLSVPKRLQSYVTTRLKILSGMDITEKRRPQDGRFRMKTADGTAIDVRASTVPTATGEKVVLRVLRSEISELNLAALQMNAETESRFRDALKFRDRIVLVCGPTGSGKTTTLYSALNELKQGHSNIITVEDPVEIRLEGTTQIQIDAKVGMTFASGLRSILRQDPDIILVGEIRDLETAEIAFQAAQTGHFVLSTLHTNSAASTVIRLLDLGLESFIIASSLGAILAQRLLRRLCPECARPLNAEEASGTPFGIDPLQLRKAVGCERCEHSGYRGRVAAYSLLTVNSAIRDLIRIRASEEKIRQTAKSYGMKDLFEAGLELASQGITTLEEIERVIGFSEALDVSPSPSVAPVLSGPAFSPPPVVEETPRSRLQTDVDLIRQTEKGSIESLAQHYRLQAGNEKKSERKKILLIDDDEGVRAVVSRILKKADFEVCEAANGYEALDHIPSFLPDIIVSDLVMPGLSGRDLIAELRRDPASCKIPIVVLTGSDDEENEIDLLTLGANDFVSKAASPALVIARLKRLL
jgi:type II secretory ATPase GspE/PulE/Tfp pilus assembly ATPase PilB-like protein